MGLELGKKKGTWTWSHKHELAEYNADHEEDK